MRRGSKLARTYTLPEIASIAEVEYRTLHVWMRRGLLRPSLREAEGAGRPNLLTPSDALKARVFADLRRAGVEMWVLERVAEALGDQNRVLTGHEYLLINGEVTVVDSAGELPEKLADASTTIVFNTSAALVAMERLSRE